MSLTEVVGDVRRDGEARAQAILAAARQEAEAILASARAEAKALEAARLGQADREAQQVAAQAASRAESDARKAVLTAEAALRNEMRARGVKDLAALPAKARQAHLSKLLETAKAAIPAGKVWSAPADAAFLAKAKPYTHAGNLPIAGGIVVESEDGANRLDLSYETLLDQAWRDVLKAEAGLFQ
jgi:vacuolar-type H+-ATPase subunit E/Vma4